MFLFVIGLSLEEPSLNRTATQPTLVAAKVWASLYPSLKRKCGVFREKLSIQSAKLVPFGHWDTNTRRLRHFRRMFVPVSLALAAEATSSITS